MVTPATFSRAATWAITGTSARITSNKDAASVRWRIPLMSWQTALHSVSYAGLWGQAYLSLDDFLERARALGFDAVMLMAKRPHLSPLDHDRAARRRLRDRLTSLKLEVACLAGYTDFCMGADRPDIPAREMQVLYVRELCRLAHDLGCGLVRVFTGFDQAGASFEQQWI